MGTVGRKLSNQKRQIEWTEQRLGRRSDEDVLKDLLANGYDASLETVRYARKKLGIGKYVPPNAPLRGEKCFG